MSATWEYKVTTLKHGGGGLQLTLTPTDGEVIAALNREGMGAGRRRQRRHCAADYAVFQAAALSEPIVNIRMPVTPPALPTRSPNLALLHVALPVTAHL